MATIIYDSKQDRSVNLDNVDTIMKSDNDGDFDITFQKLIVVRERYFHASLEIWVYKDEAERDSVYASIIQKHGENMNHQGTIVFNHI